MRVVINLSCSFDPIIALLFFMVIAASNILSINIHQTFHTHAHTQTQDRVQICKLCFFFFFFQLLHTQQKYRNRLFTSPPPTTSLLCCLPTLVAFGGDYGKMSQKQNYCISSVLPTPHFTSHLL